MHAHASPCIDSRLPRVGTTIFTVMSALAQQHGAVNLGQGFPDFDCDPRAARRGQPTRCKRGLNQYPPMAGVPALREAIAAKIESLYGHALRRRRAKITITAGATQAILTAILAIVHPGDEVIVLEPGYDSYEPNIELAGGTRGARAAHRPARSARTSSAIAAALNAAHARDHRQHAAQPERDGLDAGDMQRLAELLRPTDTLLICDEVYEHMVFDGARARERRAPRRARRAQLHRVELRQDLSRDRLEGRLRGRAGRA